MTIREIRKFLGKKANHISDEQLLKEYELAEMFANIFFEYQTNSRNKNGIKPGLM